LKAQAWISYISFDYEICREIIRIDRFAKVAYLNGDKTPRDLQQDKISGLDYHFSVLRKNESWLADARQRALSTNAWTVNDADTMLWLLDRNINHITTNEPELLLEIISKRN
jgi:glycerophosphoryl diester phosphodiesterase